MIQKITIHGFRCFHELHVEPLTRVNLFVGKNNAGKTSLLEAIELAATGRVEWLVQSAIRRRERILTRSETGEVFKEHVIDPAHLFFNRDLQPERSSFIIEFKEEDLPGVVQCSVDSTSDDGTSFWSLHFQNHTPGRRQNHRLTISPSGGVLPPPRRQIEPTRRVNFLDVNVPDSEQLGKLWDELVLTPMEEQVTSSLKIIEPGIQRLATLGDGRRFSVKLLGVDRGIPLGSLGGGLEHLLSLVLNLFSARGGFLLVDEIDTGLHYSIMVDMWRLVVETAKKLDIQVFATTHSLDCVRALAHLRNKYPALAADVTLHRVEKDALKTVVYDADELVIAAESEIEVR